LRHVLKDPVRGRYLELRGGERDALVWERLDGKRSLRDIGVELVDKTGSFPRDLGRFVARLELEGFLEPEGWTEPAPPRRPLAGTLLRFLVPLPGAGFVTALARALRFLGSPWLLGLLGAVGLAGAFAVSGLSLRGTLLPPETNWLLGLGALALVNAVVAGLESWGQALALARAGGEVRRVGIAFTLGIPEPAIDIADEAVVPVEGRTLARLAPLAIALFLGGGAALALSGNAFGGLDPKLLAEVTPWVARLVWIGLLRALIHASPFGSTALGAALGAWFHFDDLGAAARKFFAQDLVPYLDERAGEPEALPHRDRVLLAYGALSLGWLVLAARVLSHVALAEILPRLEPVVSGVGGRTAAVAAALTLALAPLAIVAWSLIAAILRGAARAFARSSLGTPQGAGIAGAIVAVVLGAAVIPLRPFQTAVFTATVGGIGALLALRASNTDGRGRAAISLTLVAAACALEALSVLIVADMGTRGAASAVLARVVAGSHRACALAFLAAALVEVASTTRTASVGALAGASIALIVAVGCLGSAFAPNSLPSFLASSGIGPVAAFLGALSYGVSAFISRGSFRPASRVVLLGAACALGIGQTAELGWPEAFARLIGPSPREIIAQALAVVWPALVAAGSIARSRERHARSYALPLDLVEPSASENEVLDALLAPLAETVREHLGKWAAVAVGREVAFSTGQGVHARALVMLESCRAVAGERYLAKYLEVALERVPSVARGMLAQTLESVPALAHLARHIVEGCPPDLARRGNLFRAVPILAPLSNVDVITLASLALREKVAAGSFVVREGEESDRFYVIAKGAAEVLVHGKDGIERTVAHLSEGDAFGETVLFRHEPRSAGVRAESELELLAVGRDVFLEFIRPRKELLAEILDRLEDVWLLRSMAVFAELESAQVALLFQRCFDVSVPQGSVIFRQGERGDRFYMIREGEVSVEVDDGKGKKRTVARLKRGDYFGEMALVQDVARAASVVALTPVELVALYREDFVRLIRGEARLRIEQRSSERGGPLEGDDGDRVV
jgi:CRP-like cAMP-binding protein